MLKIFNNAEAFVLRNIDSLYCESSEGGNKTLCFDISPNDSQYKLLAEETRLEYKNLYYLVKKINERKTISSIISELDLDELKENAYFEYTQTEVSLSTLLSNCLTSTGWTYTNANLISHMHTVDLTNVNTIDIINKAAELWNCAFSFDNKNKVIDCMDIEAIQPSGVYFTDQLNLKSIEFKGDSSNFCTRLKCRGKKDENGNYLTFESINNNKDYVENFDYCDKIITKTWIDERYTNAQSLKDDAIEKLKLLAIPARSYNCTLADLSKIDSKYSDMGINLYDIIILVDRRRKTRVKHRIVKLKEYDKNVLNNVYTLSSVQASITGKINTVKTLLDNAGEIAVDGVFLNEFKRDINTNSLEISKRYTKGETENYVSSAINQSESDITLNFQNGGLSTNVIFDTTGEKIYNGNFEIWDKPLLDTTKKKILYTDENGSLFISGYLGQPDSVMRAFIGKNSYGDSGFYVSRFNNAYKRIDGTYAPFCEIWNDGNNYTHLTGINNLFLTVKNIEGNREFNSLQCKPNGGILKGSWEIESLNALYETKFLKGNEEIAKTSWDNSGYLTLEMNGYGFGITNLGSYLFSSRWNEGHLYGTWYGTSGQAITSDRNKKNTINLLMDKYSTLFDNLKPVLYKYNDGESNRLHTGFISQDVEQAITDSGLTSNDFAGFVKDKDGNYYLRYEEFIALNTNEIQKLKNKVNQQQSEIDELKKRLDILEG